MSVARCVLRAQLPFHACHSATYFGDVQHIQAWLSRKGTPLLLPVARESGVSLDIWEKSSSLLTFLLLISFGRVLYLSDEAFGYAAERVTIHC